MRALRGGFAACVLALLVAGCFSSGAEQVPPDQRFGHRYAGDAPDGRPTITLTEPEPDKSFFRYGASIDTVHVRPGPYEQAEGRPGTRVEVLIKGTFPDACMELDGVEQWRAAHIVDLEVTVRRPQGRACAQAVRPYRYYVLLDGIFRPGDYILKVNTFNYTFTLRPPNEQ